MFFMDDKTEQDETARAGVGARKMEAGTRTRWMRAGPCFATDGVGFEPTVRFHVHTLSRRLRPRREPGMASAFTMAGGTIRRTPPSSMPVVAGMNRYQNRYQT